VFEGKRLPDPHHQVTFSVLVSLPPSYPSSAPPQLQLLSKYIGAFGVSPAIFGTVLRTFISSDGVEWTPETVCVFDGLEHAKEKCGGWYEEQLSEKAAGEIVREEAKESKALSVSDDPPGLQEDIPLTDPGLRAPVGLPEGLEIFEAESIVDRKSSFVGRACRITSPDQVRDARVFNYPALTPSPGPPRHFLPPIGPENRSSGPPGYPRLALSSRQRFSSRSARLSDSNIRPGPHFSAHRQR
jgi:hypothetical protein